MRRRTPGDYKDPDLLMDMAPYEYFDSTQRASIQRIGGSSYLALKMEKGCYGTTAGCGMQGRLPLYGDLDEATLRMTYALCLQVVPWHVNITFLYPGMWEFAQFVFRIGSGLDGHRPVEGYLTKARATMRLLSPS